jgi:hypothetical protein
MVRYVLKCSEISFGYPNCLLEFPMMILSTISPTKYTTPYQRSLFSTTTAGQRANIFRHFLDSHRKFRVLEPLQLFLHVLIDLYN